MTDFKVCPECGSEKIDACNLNPDWMIGERSIPNHYQDDWECLECEAKWQIVYYPHTILQEKY